MKISELNNKSFLGAPGAATNSYVLINYEDNTTNEPVTYKATLDELGKSIANNLHLYMKSSETTDIDSLYVENGEYKRNISPHAFMTGSQYDLIQDLLQYDYSGVASDVNNIKTDISAITDSLGEIEVTIASIN